MPLTGIAHQTDGSGMYSRNADKELILSRNEDEKENVNHRHSPSASKVNLTATQVGRGGLIERVEFYLISS